MLDIHELTAGKLSALMTRTASRDLYDAHHFLTKHTLDKKTLRFAFVVYMGMTSLDPSRLSPSIIQYDLREMHNRLMPVLRQAHIPRTRLDIKKWAEILTAELQEALSMLLPLTPDEFKFIDEIRKSGRINASLLTNDSHMQTIVTQHPAIQWASKRTKKQAPLE